MSLRAFHAACCLGLLAAACSDDFTPRSVLADLRVLAVEGSPLEVGPGQSVTLTPKRLAPPGASITGERWTFCPFSVGATVGFACAVPSCEVPLAEGVASGEPDGILATADPGALTERCLGELAAQGALPPDAPAELPRKVDTIFRYTVSASDGSTREAVQLVPFYPGGAPSPPNRPPRIGEIDIGGAAVQSGSVVLPDVAIPPLAPGAQLEVRVALDPSSVETYVDDTGVTLQETLVVSFFTTAGRFDFDRANGPDARVKLKHEETGDAVEAQLWVVATDLRGGETVAGPFSIPILR